MGGGPQVRHPRQLHFCGAPSFARCYRNQEGLPFFSRPPDAPRLRLPARISTGVACPSVRLPVPWLHAVLLLVNQWDKSIRTVYFAGVEGVDHLVHRIMHGVGKAAP